MTDLMMAGSCAGPGPTDGVAGVGMLRRGRDPSSGPIITGEISVSLPRYLVNC